MIFYSWNLVCEMMDFIYLFRTGITLTNFIVCCEQITLEQHFIGMGTKITLLLMFHVFL